MKRYRAAVIGLGAIGAGYAAQDAGRVQNHAAAYLAHEGFELVAGFDPDSAARAQFARCYPNIPTYAACDAKCCAAIDVLSVCVPTALHLEVCESLELLPLEALILEKPIAESRQQAQRLSAFLEQKNYPVVLNYMRRFDPGIQALREKIQRGDFGSLLHGTGWYQRGLLHNGSHLVDLLYYIFGRASVLKSQDSRGANSAQLLRWSQADVELRELNAAQFNLFEARLSFEHAVVELRDAAARIVVRASAEADISGRAALGEEYVLPQSDLARYQYHVVDALYRHLTRGEALASTLSTAMESSEFLWPDA